MADTTDITFQQLAGSAPKGARPQERGAGNAVPVGRAPPGSASPRSVADVQTPGSAPRGSVAAPITAGAGVQNGPRPLRRVPQVGVLASADAQLAAARMRQMKDKRRRRSVIESLSRQSKRTSTTIFGLVFIAALVLELLGLAKEPISAIPAVGALISGFVNWLILVPGIFLLVTVPMFIAQRRIRSINQATQSITTATSSFTAEGAVLYRRLRPAMKQYGKAGFASTANPSRASSLRARAHYGKHLLMSQAWVLVLEAIPVISAGPWVLTKVVRVFIQQRKESHAAQAALVGLVEAERRVAALERFELAALMGDLQSVIEIESARLTAAIRERNAEALESPAARPQALRPSYAS